MDRKLLFISLTVLFLDLVAHAQDNRQNSLGNGVYVGGVYYGYFEFEHFFTDSRSMALRFTSWSIIFIPFSGHPSFLLRIQL